MHVVRAERVQYLMDIDILREGEASLVVTSTALVPPDLNRKGGKGLRLTFKLSMHAVLSRTSN